MFPERHDRADEAAQVGHHRGHDRQLFGRRLRLRKQRAPPVPVGADQGRVRLRDELEVGGAERGKLAAQRVGELVGPLDIQGGGLRH